MQENSPNSKLEELVGSIDAIVFIAQETGFTVARLKEPKKKESVCIVGHLPSLQPGETVLCRGNWKIHPAYGRQFEVSDYTIEIPTDVMGIQKYLESGLVKGIGPVFASRIVGRFGAETLTVIDERPDRLYEVQGLGKKKIATLVECWKAQKAIREVMIFLRSHGASPSFAQKIYKAYGDVSIEKVKENPYQLAKDVFGIGFKTADSIAVKLGFALHSPQRLSAGIEFTLWELSHEGHTCYPLQDLLAKAGEILEVETALIEAEIPRMISAAHLVQREDLIWLKPFSSYEKGIAKDLIHLASSSQAIRPLDAKKAADWAQEKLNLQFAHQQREAIIQALTQKVHIITGGPGTGKSTITNGVLRIAEKLTKKIFLAAPTGRAAKRLTEITRRKAFTIHALLEMDFSSGGFKKGKENPLDCDLLIVDEASMIDTSLLFSLLRAVPSTAKLLFVGDIDQLPSVGPGTVLRDIIQSGRIGVTRLTEIFRQAKGSNIITNAHRINKGEFPSLFTGPESDFHFIEAQEPEAIRQIILELVQKEIPNRWQLDSIEEIQVLSPMKKGMLGAEMLNDLLQSALNPTQKTLFRSGRKFQVQDKVMQVRNHYDKQVFNGDIGRIAAIDSENGSLQVAFEERLVEYDFSELDELTLAYATSVHKFQGSECPCIVMPIHPSHFKLLHRNLLYTAVTRGKKQVYLVGTKQAIAIAVHNDQVQKRYTGLQTAIREALATV